MKKFTHSCFNICPMLTKLAMPVSKGLKLLFSLLLLLQFNWLHAENVLNMSPSADDACALYIGAEEVYNNQNILQGNFGSFAYADSPSRLYVHVKDPASEIITLAFSQPTTHRSFEQDYIEDVRFRILDPAGNHVTCWGPNDKNGNVSELSSGWQNLTSSNANLQTGSAGYNEVVLGLNNGFTPFVVNFTQLNCGEFLPGDYIIEFYQSNYDSTRGFYIENWDISILNNTGQRVAGRVWSNNWAIGIKQDDLNNIDPDFGRAFNGAFYACDNDNYVTKVDFNTGLSYEGFRGGTFNVFFNSSGVNSTGNILEDRKSIEDDISQDPNLRFEYKVFLEEPDILVWPEPVNGDFLLMNPFLSRCDADEYCFNVSTDNTGEIQVLIDINNNGIYNEPGELFLAEEVEESDRFDNPDNPDFPYQICVPWNGLDANGDPILTTSLDVRIYFRQGIFHYPVHDVEYSDVGYRIESIRPCLCNECGDGACPVEVYFDDTNISVENVIGPQSDLDGCSPLCHPWSAGETAAFGNRNTINTWWYAFSQNEQAIIETELEYLSCSINGPDQICFGEIATLSANCIVFPAGVPATQPLEYSWEGPGGFTANTPSIEATVNGTYSLTVFNPFAECTYATSIFLTVLSPDQCCDFEGSLPPADGGTYENVADVPPADEGDFSGLDACFVDVQFNVSETSGGGGCVTDPLVITRSWTISGDDGDPNTPPEEFVFEQTFTVIDTEAPLVASCSTSPVIDCSISFDPDVNELLDFPVATDNSTATEDLVMEYVDVFFVPTGCNSYFIQRDWYVYDNCGNSSYCVEVITVQDMSAPTATCAADIVLNCGDALPLAYSSIEEFTADGGEASDNCSTSFSISLSNEMQIAGAETLDCTLDDIWSRTYTIIDECGGMATCSQQISYSAPACDDGIDCTTDSFDCSSCSCVYDDAACETGNTYCTFTIGYWGNHIDFLETVLGGEDLVIGDYVLSLECLNYVLPGPPKHTKNATYCEVAYEDNTSMLRQTIALKLNQMANDLFQESNEDVGNLANLLLEDIYICMEVNPLDYYIETYPGITVSDLVALGEEAAAAGIDDTSLTAALDAINIQFDECVENVECLEFRSTEDDLKAINSFNVFPNPTDNFVHIDLANFAGEKGTLQIVNHIGMEIKTITYDAIPTEWVTLNLVGYPHGIYSVVLRRETGKAKVQHLVIENEF